MSGATLAPIWQLPSTITAQTLGLPFNIFRPRTIAPAISGSNLIGNTPVWITADATLMTMKAIDPRKPVVYAAIDPTRVQVGDYIQGPLSYGGTPETLFVATIDQNAAITVVLCNTVLTLSRPVADAPGANFYGGNMTNGQTPLITSWPASILPGTKGNTGDTNLPSDQRLPWVKILISTAGSVQFRFADFGTDGAEQPNRYEIGTAIQTRAWWDMTAAQVVT